MMAGTFDSGRNDQQLIRYVLGQLTEDEAEELDEASIADDAVALRLRLVEDDLVDAYVRGSLDPDTRMRFETYYLASPHRRERVRFAESFVQAVGGAPAAKARSAAEPAVLPAARRQTWNAWLPAAAVLLLAVSGSLLVYTAQLRNTLATAREQQADLDRRARELEQQLREVRATPSVSAGAAAAPESAAAPPVAAPVPGRRAPSAGALALVLLPQTRSIAAIPRLSIPENTDAIAFDLQLESNDHTGYRVALQDPATKQILWRSGWISPRVSAAASSVPVAVPARFLKPQHYSLDLAGRRSDGQSEIVGSYTVQVVPR